METPAAALVWPVIALLFAAIFASLWRADQTRTHLLQFAFGFFALFLAMSFHIAFKQWSTAGAVAMAHGLASLSIMAIVWGACSRLGVRTPLVAMLVVSLVSALLLYAALVNGQDSVALSVQNATSGLLFGMGAMLLWMARPSGVLDWVLMWTMSAIAALGLTRPAIVNLLHVDIHRLVAQQSDLNVVSMIIMTVVTVILGLCLVAVALKEALEIRLAPKAIETISGFLDQRAFEQACDTALAAARSLRMPVCLSIVQLDWFSLVNEKWGHASTTVLLREVADIIRASQRESDIVGRIGEDRFGILLVGSGSKSGLKAIENLRATVDRTCNEDVGTLMKFTLSTSLVEAKAGMGSKDLFVLADLPLKDAPARGGSLTFVDGHEIPSADLSSADYGKISSHG